MTIRSCLQAVSPALAIIGFALGSAAMAQDLSYEVVPETGQVRVGQRFRVSCSIVVAGADIESLSLPETDDFELVGQSRSEGTQVSIVNGRLSSSRTVTLTLTLMATKPGTFTIGPGEVRAGGKIGKSSPVRVQVLDAGQSAPAPGPPPAAQSPDAQISSPDGERGERLFVVLGVDTAEVYLGQQVTATLTLYSRMDLSDIRAVRLPDFEGVVVDDLITPRRVSPQPTRIGGRRYNAFMLRKLALFPTRSGLLQIPSAEVTAVVGGGFFNAGQLVRRQSEALEINVLPLPVEQRPYDFEPGNVGSFGLEVAVNRRRISQRDPLTLKVSVVGKGNFRSLTVPKLGEVDGFRVFQPTPFEETAVEAGAIHGRKGYEVLLQPQRAGELKLPVLRLSFFDPAKQGYQTVASDPIPIRVEPWSGAAQEAQEAPEKEAAELVARPVRIAPELAASSKPWPAHRFAVLLLLLNVGLLVLVGSDRLLRRRRSSMRVQRRRARDDKRRAVIAALSREETDGLVCAVEAYLEEALQIPIKGLTRDDLTELLSDRGLPEQAGDQAAAYLDAAEARRYSQTQGGTWPQLAKPARALVLAVEDALDRNGEGR